MATADVLPGSHGARGVPAVDGEVDALLDDLEAGHDWWQDASLVRRDLLARLPRTAETEVQRARLTLLGLDELVRDHGAAEAALVIVELGDRAVVRGDRGMRARASRALSWLFGKVGDPALALEHAVAALALDGDDLDAVLRCHLRLGMADALNNHGSFDDAGERYREALEHASALERPWLSLTVVNNWAYNELSAGRLAAACELVDRMQAIAREHATALNLVAAGMVAEVLHARGRSDEAVAMLREHLREDQRRRPVATSGCWLDLARMERETGDLDAAQASLDVADHVTSTYAIRLLEVEATGARAELLAARGDHAGAYEMHLRFHDQTLTLRSAASDARARTQHAMLQADTARREAARYREMSHRDPLTGLHNRRHLDTDLDARLARGDTLAIAMVDLDHFKTVNDTHSHAAGDAVLVRIAALLTDAAAAAGAPDAYAARLGGEEFLLVLPGHHLDAARDIAETLRRTIATTDWTDIAPGLPVTASTGLATTGQSRPPLDRADLLRRADHHLYAAKTAGRNRVEPSVGSEGPS